MLTFGEALTRFWRGTTVCPPNSWKLVLDIEVLHNLSPTPASQTPNLKGKRVGRDGVDPPVPRTLQGALGAQSAMRNWKSGW